MPKKATGKNKGYYERQRLVTSKHKLDQKIKRQKRLSFWIVKGVNKKGKKVLSLEERKVRASIRKTLREEAQLERRKQFRKLEAEWLQKNSGKPSRHNKRKFKPTEDE